MSVSDQLKILKHKLIGYQKTLKEVKESLENLDKKNRQEIQAQEIQLENELEQSQLSNTEKQARINQLLTEHSTELEELDNLLDEERSSYRTIRNKLISKLCENCAVCQERERMIQVYEDRVTSFKILFGITLVKITKINYMTTLQEYLTQKYPTLQDQEQLTELNLEKINQEREEQGETELLEGGELDLTTFKNLAEIEIYRQFLKTSITKLNVSGIADLSTENNRKKGVIKEVRRLSELKGVKVNFSQPSAEEKPQEGSETDIFLLIEQKDQSVKDNLKEEYQKEFELLLNPTTFPTNQLAIQELLTVYYPNLEEIADSQSKEITISPKIVDQTWSIIQHKVIELTDQELKDNLDEEKLKTLAFQLKVVGQYSILLTYHSQSPLIKELQELFTTTPLQLENELLKQEKEQLPTPENFEKLQTQNRLLDNSLQDLTDAETYQKIKTKTKNKKPSFQKITNCPNLKEINVRNNQLTKLEISGDNKIEQIIAGQNELNELNLTNCPNLKELIMPDNPYLVEIKGLNLSTIKNLNLNNTSVNLAQDYEELKAEKERLLRAIETLKEGGEEGKLMLTEAIESSSQVEENIQRHLQKTEQE
ncbi:4221_t:CDS:2 [Funneliformis geosporum]|uniref:4221_t:CDS:1 n=1 Tax=Funneliformis geosporum TaxID=1117311 RepID=A0A9W4SPI0_9GLOM|nr:4221_t:CDS:2 [Funneliformis geosporum]